MSHVYCDNELLELRSYGSKILNVRANDIYDAFANQFGLTKGNFILMYSQRIVGIIDIIQEPIHLYTNWRGNTNYIRWDSRDARQSADNGTYRVGADTFTGQFYPAGITWRSSSDDIYRYYSLVYDFDGFIYPRGYKNFLIDDVPVVTYNFVSLRSIIGVDRTLALTKIKDEFTNEGNYAYYHDHNALETVGTPVVDLLVGLGVGDSKTLITTYQKNTDIMQLSIKRNNTSGFEIGALYDVGGSKAQFNIDYGGYGSNFFLGVLVDNENEIATFTKIAISEGEVGINYNPPTKDFLALETLSHFLYLIVKGVPRDIDEDDPTGELPPAEDGGGDGDHNYTDDSVKPTPKPSNIATDLGLVTLFTPTSSQLKSLASYMWTNDLFDLDNFKKIFADPMDCILSLGVYPFNLEASDNVALAVGNISTGLLMNKLSTTEEYHDEKLGYCYIEKQLKTFLDYSPYTKLSVYLPFCSTHQLNADKYIGKNVYIFYRVNVLSGACVVYLCDGGYDGQILDQFSGNVNYNIPLTANNYQQALGSLLNLTLTTGGAVAGGVATGGASIGATVANTAQNISNLKPSIEHTGSLGGNIGSCGHLAPYFIFSCPRLVASDGKNKIIGTPSYVTKTLGDVTGYCEVQNVHVASSLANAREVAEIESLLKGGVYL